MNNMSQHYNITVINLLLFSSLTHCHVLLRLVTTKQFQTNVNKTKDGIKKPQVKFYTKWQKQSGNSMV